MKNLTKIAPIPADISKLVAQAGLNPHEANKYEYAARKAFERETKDKDLNYEWSDTGGCYRDYQTRWLFEMFLRGYIAAKEESAD